MQPDGQPTLQSVILKLQNFWADQGCLIWQPYHTEVGAGTMNPATLLHVLGPEPWWVAYVEPSFRPADGRYAENPNRWQHYFQFQVILKPDPGNPQERYLQSLVELGIDPARHDIRFVEDNWEAPTIGAWGLGWEVWLDGQEITQFTYFQQAGGQSLEPVSVEITYGLERILLALQGADTFLGLNWDSHLTYGDVQLRPEIEYCTYNFEVADVDRLQGLYEAYEAEAERALGAGLVQPAYDYVLKSSHVFNLLDARGAVGVTERAALFGRMRQLATEVAKGYLEQREEAGHPLIGRWQFPEPPAAAFVEGAPPDGPSDFVLEVGTEELPAGDLTTALEQLEAAALSGLEEARLDYEGIEVVGTPRRLVVRVRDLASSQPDKVSRVKGPPAERAYDDAGNLTKAGEGFARSKGLSAEELEVEDVDGGRYIVATVRDVGQPASSVLAAEIPTWLADLSFTREMRWNESGVSFSRPVRWLLALHGEQAIPFSFAGVPSGRHSRGLRLEGESFAIDEASAYSAAVAERGIVLDPAARQDQISIQVTALADEVDGKPIDDPSLLAEVANLVEVPTALRGAFDESYLELPRAVLISVMRKHQRYFAIESDGELLPYFIAVRNGGEQHLDTVREGNEHVLRARFADAAYFFERDLSRPLADYRSRLETMTFESSLGSMLDKSDRVERLVRGLAPELNLDSAEMAAAERAAHLAKADLATQMVVEMTSLQGEMGRIYALRSGEDEAVATAIAEHYLPRFSGDRVPDTRAGLAVGLADRLDSLVGLFAAGMAPSGAGDPFALRRTAIGLIELLVDHDQHVDLAGLLQSAAAEQPIPVGEDVLAACLDFIRRRQQALLLGQGHRHDAVEAVLAEQAANPAGAGAAVGELEGWMAKPAWDRLLQNFARCVRITRDVGERYALDPRALDEPASRELDHAVKQAQSEFSEAGSIDGLMGAIERMVPAIERFFEEVLVMAEDDRVRRNRLALLQTIAEMGQGTADLSYLEGF